MNKKIRVLIIDDSALVRQILEEILSSTPDITVVGTAQDPYIARDKIKELNPDVLTLDVEMPRMDGLKFLHNLMRLRPMPVVMVSSLTEKGADITLRALELGAIESVAKPKIDIADSLLNYSDEIITKVRIAANSRVRTLSELMPKKGESSQKLSADAVIKKEYGIKGFKTTERIIAIGASTGGIEAIKAILQKMPPDAPGTVITQHIPPSFSSPFAKRMNDSCAMTVCEAQEGQKILPGHAYIAPGHLHLLVQRDGARYTCRLNDGPVVNRHKPSVDVLFRSIAQNVGPNAIGVILTGMGNDGARGLKEMHEAGAITIAQDEKSSVVWGMPGEAVKMGGVDHIVSIDKIVGKIFSAIERLEHICRSAAG